MGAQDGDEHRAPSPRTDEVVDSTPRERKENILVVVSYEGDTDPMDPHNWPVLQRLAYTTILALLGALALWSSTIAPPALTETAVVFHTSLEVQRLPTGKRSNIQSGGLQRQTNKTHFNFLLILLAFGSVVFGPVSEVTRQNPVYVTALTLLILLDTSAALAQNLAQRIICRGLAGFVASGPFVCSAAALVDLWSLVERVYIFPYFAMFLKLAATVGPTTGSFIVMAAAVSWRFIDWASIILAGNLLVFVILFLPKTYSPSILLWKAQQLRGLTGDDRYRAPLEFKKVSLSGGLRNAFSRPIILFTTEPTIVVFAGHMSFIFVMLCTFTAGFDFIFEEHYCLNKGETGLCFLANSIGVVLAASLAPLTMILIRRDTYRAHRQGLARTKPECNLYTPIFGVPAIPISLFWMGWTARPSISIWCPLAAAVMFGSGILGIIIGSYQYITATLEYHTASALSTIQAAGLIAAGVMSILAQIMYTDLGSAWTLTLLGGITVLFLPVPYLLFIWGSQLRHWSRLAMAHE